MTQQIQPAQILKALEKGPQTWRLIILSLGYAMLPAQPAPRVTWWHRLFELEPTPQKEPEGCQTARVFTATLKDLCKVGQIVNLDLDKSDDGPYALPVPKPEAAPAKLHLTVVGHVGQKRVFVGVPREEAVKRYIALNPDLDAGPNLQVDELDITDEFGAYDAWK